MKILAIQTNLSNSTIIQKTYKNKVSYPQANNSSDSNLPYYQPTFGYCTAHYGLMKNLNSKISQSVKTNFEEYTQQLNKLNNYKEKLNFMKNAHQKAAQLVTQYSSFQYSLAEMIPSYALECSEELKQELDNSKIFGSAKDILIALGTIPKLKTKAGIDKYTGEAYTQEQTRKSKANTQLYSSVILLDLLDKQIANNKISKKELPLVQQMRASVSDAISSVYGENAYDRINNLKLMGIDASIEDKRASLTLLEEFDKKAGDIDFGKSFYDNLDELLQYKATTGKSIESDLSQDLEKMPAVILHYHTHPKEIHIDTTTTKIYVKESHNHEYEHSHEYMHEHGIPHTHEYEKMDEQLDMNVDEK